MVWFLSKNLSFCFAVFYALLLTGRTRIWDVVFAVKGHNVIRGFRDGSLFDFKLDKYIFRIQMSLLLIYITVWNFKNFLPSRIYVKSILVDSRKLLMEI